MGSRQFSVLIEGTADAAFAVDDAGLISAWNNAATKLFGSSEAETIGVRCHNILQCSVDDGITISEDCTIACMAQANYPSVNFDLRLQTRSGKVWCNLSTLIVKDTSSGARHTIYIVRPREMRKRLEQALSEFVRMQASSGPNSTPVISSIKPGDGNAALTARETEILKRLSKGNSTRTIATQLNISSATVNNHIKHILTKLDAHTRLEAIRQAERAGVI